MTRTGHTREAPSGRDVGRERRRDERLNKYAVVLRCDQISRDSKLEIVGFTFRDGVHNGSIKRETYLEQKRFIDMSTSRGRLVRVVGN